MNVLNWMALTLGVILMVLGLVIALGGTVRVAEAPDHPEACWSGTLAVQLPDMPDGYWVSYADKGASNVQICGTGLRIGDIASFPDYSATISRLESRLAACGGG